LAVWANLGEDFFLRHTPPQIADLTFALTQHDVAEYPFVAIHDTRGDVPGEGATQIYIYSNDHPQLFAASVLALSRFELSVVDATVSTSDSGICFDTYTVLDNNGQPLSRDPILREQIQSQLSSVISSDTAMQTPTQRLLPRRLRELPRPTEVRILPTTDGRASTMTILANDRPGLLATLGMLFVELELRLLSAKITTLGERVEDIFIIQTAALGAIEEGETTYTLENTIRQRLDRMVGAR
jgi:[protein-PII] uridylyltransferase